MKQTLRAVLVGCGGISQTWLKPIGEIEGLEMVGLVDLRRETARERAAQFGLEGVEIGDNLPVILDRTQPDIVFDCTVPEAHVDVTLEALGRGMHVLGEKPMADSMENARRMVAKAQESGKLYAVMQNRRYQAEIRALRDYLRSGEIGPLTTVNSDFFLGPHFGGFRDVMKHVLLVDMAIHSFDQMRFLTGAKPEAVYCKEWNPQGSWYSHGASAVAVFEMSGGLVYTYRGSWCAEGLMTSWECDWRLIGTRGTALWDGGEKLQAEWAEHPAGGFFAEKHAGVITPYGGNQVGGHGGLIRDFVDCVREGRAPETVCTDNIQSLAMVFGALESAETGQRVEIVV
ncbi:MAG: Gfo/Idh/MocA family oxidoreductase [Anaerolineaceae bacterium]|nr:Gfo/Idh/MocA family oxidoreductase [Anaerolineaceae bacterium]